jgi:endonuclease G, mitochondrial
MIKKVNPSLLAIVAFLSVYCLAFGQPQVAKPLASENINMLLGNPSKATPDTSNANNFLMVKTQYSLSYNNKKHIPNWVSWHVGTSDLQAQGRQNDFRADASLPVSWYHVLPSDYKKTGFDKGHQCPSGDRTGSVDDNSATFLMTNMIPQAPSNNRVTWEHLEAFGRKLIEAGNELYVICGVYGKGGVGSAAPDTMRTLQHDIVVPSKTWKIIVVLPEGEKDLSRINAQTRVIAVLMPNTQDCSLKAWGNYRVSVDSIEKITGYDFLSNVPVNIQKVIEAKVDDGQVK